MGEPGAKFGECRRKAYAASYVDRSAVRNEVEAGKGASGDEIT
jgi:hypothetical protein